MNNSELNYYIKDYIEKNRTQSAIMLTGSWGIGKSYYIHNNLIPFLEKKENGNHSCIVVSLYGILSLSELSKAIYFETRVKKLTPKSEAGKTAIFAGKTVLIGVADFFGVNISAKEKDLQKLYASINLSGKLLILEDLERSQINILDLLGYINNLVEQDTVKVLIVANENEFIKYESDIDKNNKKSKKSESYKNESADNRVLTASTIEYFKIKEKTISDTITFYGDFYSAIKEIIISFGNPNLNNFADVNSINEIVKFCHDKKISNLRTFIFACQKTVDIFSRFETDAFNDGDFSKTVFFGIIAFSNLINKKSITKLKDNDLFSVDLATEKYPLLRVCYDYIVNQKIDFESIKKSKDVLKTYRLYNKSFSNYDRDLKIINNIWINTEIEVINAVNSISEKLEKNSLPLYSYGRLAIQLITAKHLLNCDIENSKYYLIKNLKNKGATIDYHYLFSVLLSESESPEIINEFNELKTKMIESLDTKDESLFGFDYLPSSISDFYNNVVQNEGLILNSGAFTSRLNVNKTIEMLKQCTAQEILDFRGAFLAVYRSSINIKEYLADDIDSINELRSKLVEIKEYKGFDRIQKKQIEWFIDNLSNSLLDLQ